MVRRKQTKEKIYSKPRMGEILKFVAEKYNILPEALAYEVLQKFPELENKERCANCNASMSVYQYTLDALDALLLLGMGKIVGQKAKEVTLLRDANRVYIQQSLNKYYSVASRTTQCRYFGLIAKVLHKDGSHNKKAGWCITKRGFEFLAGKPVPRRVNVFRNKIVERFEEDTITIQEIIAGEVSNNDVRAELSTHSDYKFDNLETWAIAGFNQRELL